MRKPGGLSKFLPTDREECGILVETEDLLYVVKVPNVASHNDDYAISLLAMQEVEDTLEAGEKIIGFFHTHLAHHDCEPSDADFAGAEIFPRYNNLIYKPDTGELCWYGATEVGN